MEAVARNRLPKLLAEILVYVGVMDCRNEHGFRKTRDSRQGLSLRSMRSTKAPARLLCSEMRFGLNPAALLFQSRIIHNGMLRG